MLIRALLSATPPFLLISIPTYLTAIEGNVDISVSESGEATSSVTPLKAVQEKIAVSAQSADGKKMTPLKAKTLVAWVHPANLTQQGGSVLTLIDKAERFDAIVLGEVAEGKWMAGSDFFRRTQKDQSTSPVEVADGKTQIQIAIAYEGDHITIFRNGKEYASYGIGQLQCFGDDAMVLIGLRYVGEMGEIGFFAGSIEEVRIYDVALNAEQLASLAPNKPSEPQPLAMWTFEGGEADDVMKTFPASRLEGNTRVADGKLHLDGRGFLWAARDKRFLTIDDQEETPLESIVQTMFYKASSKRTGNMWDTWLYFHEGTYYLYYLAKAGSQWDNISMASSSDAVHWKEIGRILVKGRGVTWMGTGSTWKSPNYNRDGKFVMNFSEWRGPRQTIFFAESKDLVHWIRLGDEYEFKQDERWYQTNGRWDCIWTIRRPAGGLYGYWTATPRGETGGCFGFGETNDGVHWQALAPPKVEGVERGEVGAIEKIGDKYYMMFGANGKMMTLIADKPEGPFHQAEKNLYFLAGHTYFSRFFTAPQGDVLVNHHSIARDGQVSFAPLKEAVVDREGTFRLGWWEGNERMKHDPIKVKVSTASKGSIMLLDNTVDVGQGLILEGEVTLPESEGSPRRGVYIGCGEESGAAILINAQGVAELGPMRADGSDFKAVKKVDREMTYGNPAKFRLLLNHSLLEFYLDDILIECFSLPGNATGRIGLILGGDIGSVKNLKAWR